MHAVEESSDLEKERVQRSLETLLTALINGFMVVDITLEEGDDAQVIFETLNARGEPLLATDLIRNDIFQRADSSGEEAKKLFDEQWKYFEDQFWTRKEKQG